MLAVSERATDPHVRNRVVIQMVTEKITERTILRIVTALDVGATSEDVVAILFSEGIENYDAFLIHQAAQVYIQMRDNS